MIRHLHFSFILNLQIADVNLEPKKYSMARLSPKDKQRLVHLEKKTSAKGKSLIREIIMR